MKKIKRALISVSNKQNLKKLLSTLKKSRPVNPSPRPSIIRASEIGAIFVTISTI